MRGEQSDSHFVGLEIRRIIRTQGSVTWSEQYSDKMGKSSYAEKLICAAAPVVLFCPAGEEPAGLLVGTPEPPPAGPSVVVPFVPLLMGAGVLMICGGARAGAVTAFLVVSAFDRIL